MIAPTVATRLGAAGKGFTTGIPWIETLKGNESVAPGAIVPRDCAPTPPPADTFGGVSKDGPRMPALGGPIAGLIDVTLTARAP